MENINAIASVSARMPARELSVVTEEIKELRLQANRMALTYAIEIGRRLHEAKSLLPHGAWGEWLKNEVEFSQATANNFMKLFDEYGADQISIFGAVVNSQSFANLPYSKALQLLAVPRDEREAFVEEIGADELSVKELKAAIEERDKARKMAEAQKALKEDLADKLAKAEAATHEALIKADEAEKYKNRLDEMTKTLERERKNAADLRVKLKKAENDPKIPKETLDKLRAEAEKAARKEAEENAKSDLKEAEERASAAEAEAAKARLAADQAKERLEEAQKKLKTASPEVTAFKVLFDSLQETAGKLKKMIEKIRESDADVSEKLASAMKAFGATL